MPSFKEKTLNFIKTAKKRILKALRLKGRECEDIPQANEEHFAPVIELEMEPPIEETGDQIFTNDETKFELFNLLPFSIHFKIVEEIGSEFVLKAEKANYLRAKHCETLIAEFLYNETKWTFQAKFGSLKQLETAKFFSKDNQCIDIGSYWNQSTFTFFQRIRLINNTANNLEYTEVVKFLGDRRFKQIYLSSSGHHPVYLKYEPDYLFVAESDTELKGREVWTRVPLINNIEIEINTIDGCSRPIAVTNQRNGLEREIIFSLIDTS